MSTDTFPNPWRIRSNDKVHKIIEKYIYIYLDAELGINFRILLLPPPSPLGKTLGGGERNFSSGASKGSLYLFVWVTSKILVDTTLDVAIIIASSHLGSERQQTISYFTTWKLGLHGSTP